MYSETGSSPDLASLFASLLQGKCLKRLILLRRLLLQNMRQLMPENNARRRFAAAVSTECAKRPARNNKKRNAGAFRFFFQFGSVLDQRDLLHAHIGAGTIHVPGGNIGDLVHDVHTVHDMAERGILLIEIGRVLMHDEELRRCGVEVLRPRMAFSRRSKSM